MYSWEWGFVWQYKLFLLEGILVTAWLSLLTIVFGTALGALLACAKRSSHGIVRLAARAYIEVFRAIPLLVLLMWVYFVLPILLGVRMSEFFSAVIALVLNLSAFAAENIRAGLEAITDSQRESGFALGLSRWQTGWRIILPQAVRNMFPNLMDQWITSIKLTSLASVIGVRELLGNSRQIISFTALPLEVYTVLAILYCSIICLLSTLAKFLETKLSLKGRD